MCSRTIKTELEEGRTKPEVCTPGIVITCLSPVLLNNFPPLTLHLSNVVSLPVLWSGATESSSVLLFAFSGTFYMGKARLSQRI